MLYLYNTCRYDDDTRAVCNGPGTTTSDQSDDADVVQPVWYVPSATDSHSPDDFGAADDAYIDGGVTDYGTGSYYAHEACDEHQQRFAWYRQRCLDSDPTAETHGLCSARTATTATVSAGGVTTAGHRPTQADDRTGDNTGSGPHTTRP